jgi:ATP-binding cassette subfamily B protein
MKEEEKQPSPFQKLWRWGKPYHAEFSISVILAVLGVASQMVPYFCIATMIAQLLVGGREFSFYLQWCLIALAGYVGKVVFSSLSTAISHTATFHTLRDIRRALIEKLSKVPMGTILNTPSGQYKTTIVDRVEAMEPTLAHLIPEMTANVLIPVAILIYLFILDWRMALCSLVTLVFGFLCITGSMKNYVPRWEGAVAVGRKMSNAIVEYVGGIQVVKAFSQSAGSYKKYSSAVTENAQYYVDWMRENQRYMCGWNAIVPAVLVTILPAGYGFWSSGSLEMDTFLTVIILSLGLTGPIVAAMTFVDDLAVVGTNVGEISGILDSEELNRPDKKVSLNNTKIELTNVGFSYEKDSEKVLKGINLTIAPATVTAFVGPSGSGKSTIAKLIAGFWDVRQGSITLGGVDLREITLDELNQQIAYVSQDNYLFNRTVRENIRMGRQSATDKEVEAVSKASGCDTFIRNLENGYDTIAGGGGGHLSGGEKQRISIARAMLKDAPIVIMDEATASIDPENEAEIQKALSVLTKGKTLIVIAHRLSTIADADKIVVVKDGKIEASGTHQQLLNASKLYASMWKTHMDVADQA